MRDAGFARDAAIMAEHDYQMDQNRKFEPGKSIPEIDEMYAFATARVTTLLTQSLGTAKSSNPSSTNTTFANYTFSPFCAPKTARSSTIWPA